MRIALLSDLHLSVGALPFPAVDADVLVLAGDLSRPGRAMEWAKAASIPTIYVAGNHEFYGSDLVTTYAQLRSLASGTQVHILECSEWHHEGVRFLGCTLWSDFRIFDSPQARDKGIADAVGFTHDFSRIRLAPDFAELFTPAVSQLLFLQSVAWLEACFARPHAGPTVVVTHFAPSLKSISPQFRGSAVNACFVSDLDDRILKWQPALWLHGHTHDSFDYRIGRTRVVCNARGYTRRDDPMGTGQPENPKFDEHLVLELDVAPTATADEHVQWPET